MDLFFNDTRYVQSSTALGRSGVGNLWSLTEKLISDPGKDHVVLFSIHDYWEMM